jgi:ubiquinone/menaquinone biosynthesis C-methylase UbiE
VPIAVRKQFYEALDRAYPARSNTHGSWNYPAAIMRELERAPRVARVLELGAGGGFLGAELARHGFQRLTLSDLTTTALAALRERAPTAQLVCADAERLPFATASFDIVISSDLLEHLPDAETHLAEVARVLRAGGRYYLKSPNRRMAEAYYRLRGLHDAYFWHPSMVTPRELRDACARHGLRLRLLTPQRLTGAQLAKLPGPTALRSLAGRLPVGWLPVALGPHLEAVAVRR